MARQVKEARLAYKASRQQLAAVKAESLRKTCSVTAAGNQRKAALTLQACRQLVPPMFAAGSKVSKYTNTNLLKCTPTLILSVLFQR